MLQLIRMWSCSMMLLKNIKNGLAGIFVGRGAMSNPFVFVDILKGKTTNLRSDPALCLSVLERYHELLLEQFEPGSCVGKMKQLASQLCKGHVWRKPLLQLRTYEELTQTLSSLREKKDDPWFLGRERVAERCLAGNANRPLGTEGRVHAAG